MLEGKVTGFQDILGKSILKRPSKIIKYLTHIF